LVRDLMTREVVTVRPETTAVEALVLCLQGTEVDEANDAGRA
jgi:CBS-domain-containing membrane protein